MKIEIVIALPRAKYWTLMRQLFVAWLTGQSHIEQRVNVYEGQIERMVSRAIRNNEESVTQRLN